MGEYDHLAVPALTREPFGNGLSVKMVERGHGIVKDNARMIVGRGELGHEAGQRNASMFSFAQDLSGLGIGFVNEAYSELGNAVLASFLLQFDGKPCDPKVVHLLREAPSKPICSVSDDHIDPRRSALFMARSVLREVRDGGQPC